MVKENEETSSPKKSAARVYTQAAPLNELFWDAQNNMLFNEGFVDGKLVTSDPRLIAHLKKMGKGDGEKAGS